MANPMKKIGAIILIVIVVIMLPDYTKGDEILLRAEDAYEKSIQLLIDMGAIPSFRDRELMLIRTDPIPVKLTGEECDCGTMFGIPYIKDKRVKTGAIYQVHFKRIDDGKSDVNLKITIDGYMDINEGAPFFIEKTRNNNRLLMCKSTGLLERKFIAALSE